MNKVAICLEEEIVYGHETLLLKFEEPVVVKVEANDHRQQSNSFEAVKTQEEPMLIYNRPIFRAKKYEMF